MISIPLMVWQIGMCGPLMISIPLMVWEIGMCGPLMISIPLMVREIGVTFNSAGSWHCAIFMIYIIVP